jgi:hypothetical protein
LNLPRYNHFFNELDQLKINNIKYDDSVWQGEYHNIRTKISRNQYDIKDYLPQSVINKYKQV